MRELKFRIWNELQFVTKSEVYIKASNGSLWDYDDGNLWSATAKIQQFTGLLDKNGVEIYEGDILSYEGIHKVGDGISIVSFKDGSFRFGDEFADQDSANYYEIIGNIFENSELLKA